MKELFQNSELADVLPQFTQKEIEQDNLQLEAIAKRIEQYITKVFAGKRQGDKIVIESNYLQSLQELAKVKIVVESMQNHMPTLLYNLRQNTKVITPFISIGQLKELTSTKEKVEASNSIIENILYNPDFHTKEQKKRQKADKSYLKKQAEWMKRVGYQQIKER